MCKFIFRIGVRNCVIPRALTCTILYGYFMCLLQIKLHLKREELTVQIKCCVYMKLETARNLSLVGRRALNKTSSVSIVKANRCINISNLFYWSNSLHVSNGLSTHHQEFKTVHTATGICQTDTAVCLLASRQQYLFDKCLLPYVQS